MLFQIQHSTRFTYTKPVFCEPLTVRLRPRDDSTQRLAQFQVRVTPAPAQQTHYLDLNGNNVAHCWFQGLTTGMLIATDCVVETLRNNPFDFIVSPEAAELPWGNSEWMGGLFDYYRQDTVLSPPLEQFVADVLDNSKRRTVEFLSQLVDRLYRELETILRPEGPCWDGQETWQQKRGACRDQAVLFNQLCRSVGIPSRFVSGYALTDDELTEHHLHAWSEVYLPGAGWRGFDPTTGLAVADHHVALAAGRAPEDAAPTTGSFRGTNAKSRLETQLLLRATSNQSLPPRPNASQRLRESQTTAILDSLL